MRGASSLLKHLDALGARHGVSLLAPCRVPLTPPPDHDTLILEGIASTPQRDCDRTLFAARCFGILPATIPLLIEHDAARPAGTATPYYDAQGGLRVRTSPLSGDARRYAAFSTASRIIHYSIHDADSRHFSFEVTAAELTEISLTQHPHLDAARVLNRMRPAASAEFFDLMARRTRILTQMTVLMRTMQKEAIG